MRGQLIWPVSFRDTSSASEAVSTRSTGRYRSSVRRSKIAVFVADLVSGLNSSRDSSSGWSGSLANALTFCVALSGPNRETKRSYERFRCRRASVIVSSGASCKLCAKDLAHGVTDLKHAANPRGSRRWEGERFELIAAANDDLPIAIGQPTFFDCPHCRNLVFTGRMSGCLPLSNRIDRRRADARRLWQESPVPGFRSAPEPHHTARIRVPCGRASSPDAERNTR